MPRVKFARVRDTRDEPLVTIRDGRFNFNAHFCRLAELEKFKYVVYHIDEDVREICFEFLVDDSDDNAYKLENRGGPGKFRCGGMDLIARKPWVKAVARAKDASLRTFLAKRDGRLWCIRLAPSFEQRVSRADAESIPTDAGGIYRYVGDDGEVVYIGKGNIRKRLADPERQDWSFATIEFSVVPNEQHQFDWESFWIDRHRDTHGGRLPHYNRQAGNTT